MSKQEGQVGMICVGMRSVYRIVAGNLILDIVTLRTILMTYMFQRQGTITIEPKIQILQVQTHNLGIMIIKGYNVRNVTL